MDFQKVIDNRHSVREFENRKISKKIIEKLISNAIKAPSAKNDQNWKFYVVNNDDGIKKVIEILHEISIKNNFDFSKLEPKIKKSAEIFYNNLGNAPCIIFVFRDKKECAPVYQDLNDIASISCAVENLILSAVNEGLGVCWVGTFNREENISRLVGASSNEELIASVVLGYPKKKSKILLRDKKKLKEVIYFV